MKTIIALIAAAAGLTLGVTLPAAAGTPGACVTVHDHITKTDSGHGTPAEWADLVMARATSVCGGPKDGYTVTLTDTGRLWTRPAAGTPNGTGGQIALRVPGTVHGVYHLTVTGGTLEHRHGDVTASSTEYVRSLFSDGATVTGGAYAWTYATRCEKWLDSSANNDGMGEQAGNITGKRCPRAPKPTPSPTGSVSPSPSPSSPVAEPSAPGEAPVPTPVHRDFGVTG